MFDNNFNEETISSSMAALNSMFYLASLGYEEAKKLIKESGINSSLMSISLKASGIYDLASEEFITRLNIGATVGAEARYLRKIMLSHEYDAIYDIASGYNPIGLKILLENKEFVGLDIPSVASKLQDTISEMLGNSNHIYYYSGDATNGDDVLAAAKDLKENIFVSCEGLIPYLNKSELGELCKNIKRLLEVHGGAWYTCDFGTDYSKIEEAVIGVDDAIKKIKEINELMGIDTNHILDGFKDEEEKEEFIEDFGFKIEKIPLFDKNITLLSLDKVPEERRLETIEALKNSYVWKITVDNNANKEKDESIEEREEKKASTFSADFRKEDDILYLTLRGRIDSVTAPELQTIYRENNQGIKHIEMNMRDLVYMSSAGLRVILMMSQDLGQKNVLIKEMNIAVREIFESTGFDSVCKIIEGLNL